MSYAWVWPIWDIWDAGSRTLRDIWRHTDLSPVPIKDRRDACPTPGFGRLGTSGTDVLRLGLELVQMSAD